MAAPVAIGHSRGPDQRTRGVVQIAEGAVGCDGSRVDVPASQAQQGPSALLWAIHVRRAQMATRAQGGRKV
jgi:hypothetical protein